MIRPGRVTDVQIVLDLFDGAVEWLVAHGRSAQWGSAPWSSDPKRVERVHGMVAAGELHVAEIDGAPVGILLLGEPLPYVPPVDEPEVYIDLLLTARRHAGSGIGSALLAVARERARAQGISLLRVDCWAGGDRKLVAYYENQGFSPTVEVPVNDTSAQVFEQRL